MKHQMLLIYVILLFSSSILCFQPAGCTSDSGNEADRVALLEFKAQISNDPYQILQSWNDSVEFCSWYGVTCGRKHRRVVSLTLTELSFSGTISRFIGNLTFLRFLNLRNNFFRGIIPQEIGHLFRLRYLNLFNNTLRGDIPVNIFYCSELRVLSVAKNHLAGEIPSDIGNLKKLIILHLSRNSFTGKLPRAIGNLSSIQQFGVGENNLVGNIPNELGQLRDLSFLNLAINYLTGNKNLCGGITELQLPPCPVKKKKHQKSTTAVILAVVISFVVIFTLLAFCYILYQKKSRTSPSSNPFTAAKLPLISYNELLQATRGFSPDNIIGEGSFGTVYKGSVNMQGEKLIAVKVLKLQKDGACKSFLAECKALHNIRHRNLVRVLTCCSSIDFNGNEFKALVFDYMENGSLEMWLHPGEDGCTQSKCLTLLQRLHAAIDVSSALHYLHENCEPPIVHCDLKPSNILFDTDMTAHIGDFGLARLLPNTTGDDSRGQSSSFAMKGTIGYMAPENGVGSQATTYGDVYSFGIILLEILTGLRPTEQMFKDGLNLRDFVKAKLPQHVFQIVDPVLVTTGELVAGATTSEATENDDNMIREDGLENFAQVGEGIHKCIASVLEIALACSAEQPASRMNMGDVNRKLNVITETFLRTRACRTRQMVTQ